MNRGLVSRRYSVPVTKRLATAALGERLLPARAPYHRTATT